MHDFCTYAFWEDFVMYQILDNKKPSIEDWRDFKCKVCPEDPISVENYWWGEKALPIEFAKNLAKEFGYSVKFWLTYNSIANLYLDE